MNDVEELRKSKCRHNNERKIMMLPSSSPLVAADALPCTLKAAKGLLNHWSNVSTLLKIVGSKKFSRAHSSGKLFCRGVPKTKEKNIFKGSDLKCMQYLTPHTHTHSDIDSKNKTCE